MNSAPMNGDNLYILREYHRMLESPNIIMLISHIIKISNREDLIKLTNSQKPESCSIKHYNIAMCMRKSKYGTRRLFIDEPKKNQIWGILWDIHCSTILCLGLLSLSNALWTDEQMKLKVTKTDRWHIFHVFHILRPPFHILITAGVVLWMYLSSLGCIFLVHFKSEPLMIVLLHSTMDISSVVDYKG